MSWKNQSSSSISSVNDNGEAVSEVNKFIVGDVVCTDQECHRHSKRIPLVPTRLQ